MTSGFWGGGRGKWNDARNLGHVDATLKVPHTPTTSRF